MLLLLLSRKNCGLFEPLERVLPVSSGYKSASLPKEADRDRDGVPLRLISPLTSLGMVYCVFQALTKHFELQKVAL